MIDAAGCFYSWPLLLFVRIVCVYLSKLKIMNTLLSVSELNDERYVQINDLVSEDAVMNFIDACEAIETELAEHNIDAKEMYKYMLTLMLNQA